MIARYSRLVQKRILTNLCSKRFSADKHDHDHHHGQEVVIPGPNGNYGTQFDWRRDPCLEWGYESHHSHKQYDWRDDPKHNPDLYIDVRDKGATDAVDCSFPYNKAHDSEFWTPQMPQKCVASDITVNCLPQNKKNDLALNRQRAPYWKPDDDVAHEYDYESEDLDFQCESFKMQHFKKQGPISSWFIVALLPVIYFQLEYLYQHFPDEDNWKIPHPPPLNYPDTEDTDDTDTWNDYNNKEGKYLRDSGIVGDLWFDIVDGKKVYKRFAGVNQPLPDI